MAKKEVKILINARDNASREIDKVGKKLKTALTVGAAAGGFAIGKLGTHAIKIAANWEQTQVAFETMIGSGREATQLLKELTDFSTRTPFEPEQITKTAKTLLGFGFATKDILSIIEKLGDVSAGTGKDLEELGRIYGKVFVKGKAQGEELNQMLEAGIPVLDALAAAGMGAKSEIFKLGSEGKIAFSDIDKAFSAMTGTGGKFFKMMDKQSTTVIGKWSTLKGNFDELAKSLGTRLLPLISTILDKLNKTLSIDTGGSAADKRSAAAKKAKENAEGEPRDEKSGKKVKIVKPQSAADKKATEKVSKAQADRMKGLKEQLNIQNLINQKKNREAFIQKEVNDAQKTLTDTDRCRTR